MVVLGKMQLLFSKLNLSVSSCVMNVQTFTILCVCQLAVWLSGVSVVPQWKLMPYALDVKRVDSDF